MKIVMYKFVEIQYIIFISCFQSWKIKENNKYIIKMKYTIEIERKKMKEKRRKNNIIFHLNKNGKLFLLNLKVGGGRR